MGYNIYYEGKIELDKPLDDETYRIIMGLAETRRMRWDADKLERDGIALKSQIGQWGEFFFVERERERELEDEYIIDYNSPPAGQPQLWGVWKVANDRLGLVWNRNGKSYGGHEWLKYLVKRILVPRGYYSKGIINWFTEGQRYDNEWHTIVEGKSVRKYRGYNRKQKEPDIDVWYEEMNGGYDDKDHQNWLRTIMEKRVNYIDKHPPWPMYIDKTDAEYVLSFYLYVDDSIIQAQYDGKKVCFSYYVYEDLKIQGDEISHKSSRSTKVVTNDETLSKAENLIEEYIASNPEVLEKVVA
ncbi:hypothetical protein [Niallia circulans]|uniref:hypothetical protein n=1 Tax=Niallia circulans TaxID=1397 RepID=UPI00300B5A13